MCLTFLALPASRQWSMSPRHRIDVCLYVGVCVSLFSLFIPVPGGASHAKSRCAEYLYVGVCVSHLSGVFFPAG